MKKTLVISVALLILVKGTHAQGFLGRLKKEALDTAKNAANETANQSAPSADTQKGSVNQVNQDAAVEKQRAEEDARQKEIQAEREAAIAKMDADRKEREAKREAEAVERERREKEETVRFEKEAKEEVAKEKNDAREKVFEELRTGEIKTVDIAKEQLQDRNLWQEGMEDKLQKITAERMQKITQNKFPVSDTFKTPVKIYKEFESGMSLEWCKAKLETDGSDLNVNNDTIALETEGSAVTLIFKKLTTEKPPVLTACVVALPASIRHSQVLEKYKRETPNATVNHEEIPRKLPKQDNYVKDGVSLDMQFSMIQLTDILSSPAQTVTIESKLLVGKAYLIYHIENRKVLVCASSKDGVVTVPKGLDTRQQEAAGVIKDQTLPAVQRTVVVIEDTAMARALKDMQQVEQKNEKNKQQQKNAAALAF